ncbi:unnamed protein product [Aspergillus oryzae var. brunneus]|uniref:Unnamed protein product n=1 Tax=Aspergillus oryzae var. brunneus TaxID=332754 RepID=A0ABQ6L7G6_ASPOZ|nr:unnamed protein product [Aspergillus oryzae var. brunneus]
MWYKTDDDSVVQSMVFPATKVNMAGETAVALAKVRTGKLGYVGDVNAEEGSNAVVLAMYGLLYSSSVHKYFPFVSVSALLVQERNVSQFYKEWEIQLLRIVSGDRSYQGRWQVSQLQISDKSQIN